MRRYFYVTIHFSPKYEGTVVQKFHGDLYLHAETGATYRKRLLYDFGWGQEYGFELLPSLGFEELIKLIEQPVVLDRQKNSKKISDEKVLQYDIWRCNLYGAVSVIMQDYVDELIEFLASKVDTDYFKTPSLRNNFKCFCFDSMRTREEGKIPGGVLTRSYEDILNAHPKWENISSKVISQVYA